MLPEAYCAQPAQVPRNPHIVSALGQNRDAINGQARNSRRLLSSPHLPTQQYPTANDMAVSATTNRPAGTVRLP
jgi:hypothetical protein